jgi:hypothetical protein
MIVAPFLYVASALATGKDRLLATGSRLVSIPVFEFSLDLTGGACWPSTCLISFKGVTGVQIGSYGCYWDAKEAPQIDEKSHGFGRQWM